MYFLSICNDEFFYHFGLQEPSSYPTPAPSPTFSTGTASPTFSVLTDTYKDTLSYVQLVLTLGYSYRSYGQPISDTNTLIFDENGVCQSALRLDALYSDDREFFGLNTSLTRLVFHLVTHMIPNIFS